MDRARQLAFPFLIHRKLPSLKALGANVEENRMLLAGEGKRVVRSIVWGLRLGCVPGLVTWNH